MLSELNFCQLVLILAEAELLLLINGVKVCWLGQQKKEFIIFFQLLYQRSSILRYNNLSRNIKEVRKFH